MKVSKAQNPTYVRRVTSGLCGWCGAPMSAYSTCLCDTCLEKARLSSRRRYRKDRRVARTRISQTTGMRRGRIARSQLAQVALERVAALKAFLAKVPAVSDPRLRLIREGLGECELVMDSKEAEAKFNLAVAA